MKSSTSPRLRSGRGPLRAREFMAGAWSGLTSDVLNVIGDILIADVVDYVRFRTVCKAWLSATPDLSHRYVPPQLPWHCDFFYDHPPSAGAGRTERREEPIVCSSDGWLVLMRPRTEHYVVLNPLTDVETVLPPLPPNDGGVEVIYLRSGKRITKNLGKFNRLMKLAMSGNPSSTGDGGCTFLATIAWPWALVSLRAGDDTWAMVDDTNCYTDVVYFNGSFFAVDSSRRIAIFSSNAEKVATLGPQVPRLPHSEWRLVVAPGKLFVLRKVHGSDPFVDGDQHSPRYMLERVQIFTFDPDRKPMFVEVKSLEDHILFLGHGSSAAVPAKNYRDRKGNMVHCLVELFVRGSDSVVCESSGGDYVVGEREASLDKYLQSGHWYVPKPC